MKRYIIAFLLLSLSFNGFAMNEEGYQYPIEFNDFNKWKHCFTEDKLSDCNQKNNSFRNNPIFLLVTIPSKIFPKKIKICPPLLASGFKSFEDFMLNPGETNEFPMTVEDNNYPYFCILILLLHDIEQYEHAKEWKLKNLESFITLTKNLNCTVAESKSIYKFVKFCTANLAREEIEILLTRLPAEPTIKKAVLKGVSNFSTRKYASFADLPDNLYEFSSGVVYEIFLNPNFKVNFEENFALSIFQWLAAREIAKKVVIAQKDEAEFQNQVKKPNEDEHSYCERKRNLYKKIERKRETYKYIKEMFNLFSEPEKNWVSNEAINKLFGLIRFPYLSEDFVMYELKTFYKLYPRPSAIKNFYVLALEFSIANEDKGLLQSVGNSRKRADVHMKPHNKRD